MISSFRPSALARSWRANQKEEKSLGEMALYLGQGLGGLGPGLLSSSPSGLRKGESVAHLDRSEYTRNMTPLHTDDDQLRRLDEMVRAMHESLVVANEQDTIRLPKRTTCSEWKLKPGVCSPNLILHPSRRLMERTTFLTLVT
jgi:hypothetical protein